MKRLLWILWALAACVALHAHAGTSVLLDGTFGGTSLTPPWTLDSGSGTVVIDSAPADEFNGTQSAAFDPGNTGTQGHLFQTFPTTAGTEYILQFTSRGLVYGIDSYPSSYLEVIVSDGGYIPPISYGSVATTGSFTTVVRGFIAQSGSASISIFGSNQVLLSSVIVETGSFAKYGRYAGTAKVTGTMIGENISSFHTESVVARITPTGGLYIISQPSGAFTGGILLENGTSCIMTDSDNGKPITINKAGNSISFGVTSTANVITDFGGIQITGTPTAITTYNLTRVGN